MIPPGNVPPICSAMARHVRYSPDGWALGFNAAATLEEDRRHPEVE